MISIVAVFAAIFVALLVEERVARAHEETLLRGVPHGAVMGHEEVGVCFVFKPARYSLSLWFWYWRLPSDQKGVIEFTIIDGDEVVLCRERFVVYTQGNYAHAVRSNLQEQKRFFSERSKGRGQEESRRRDQARRRE